MTSPEELAGPDRARRLFGAEVVDVDGAKVGTVREVFLDDATDRPSWVSVRTGWFGTNESLVPLQDAEISGDRIRVPFDKATIVDAPRSDEGQALSRDDEGELYRHYHRGSSGGRGQIGDAATDGRKADERVPGERDVDRRGVDVLGGAGPDDIDGAVGPDTGDDGSVVRSEERLAVSTERIAAGRARIRKFLVTEEQQITVSVAREDVRVEYVTESDLAPGTTGSAGFSEQDRTAPDAPDDPRLDSTFPDNSATAADAGYGDTGYGDTGHDTGHGDGRPGCTDGSEWVVLYAQRPVVTLEWVPVERVRLGTVDVSAQESVSGEVRKEQLEVIGDDAADRDRVDGRPRRVSP